MTSFSAQTMTRFQRLAVVRCLVTRSQVTEGSCGRRRFDASSADKCTLGTPLSDMSQPHQRAAGPVLTRPQSVVVVLNESLSALRFASAVLTMALCVSVRLSATSRYCIETAEQIELILGIEATVSLSYIVLEGNSAISKHKGTSLSNFVPNTGRRKVSQLHVDLHKCCQLRWTLNWRRSSVASLSYWVWEFTLVYNTMGVTQRMARVCLWQLTLVSVSSY